MICAWRLLNWLKRRRATDSHVLWRAEWAVWRFHEGFTRCERTKRRKTRRPQLGFWVAWQERRENDGLRRPTCRRPPVNENTNISCNTEKGQQAPWKRIVRSVYCQATLADLREEPERTSSLVWSRSCNCRRWSNNHPLQYKGWSLNSVRDKFLRHYPPIILF